MFQIDSKSLSCLICFILTYDSQVIVVENSTDEEDEETKALNPLPLV